jgi:hypothetical protein
MPKAEPVTPHTRQLPGYRAEWGTCASGTNGRALWVPAITRVLCLMNPEMPEPRARSPRNYEERRCRRRVAKAGS